MTPIETPIRDAWNAGDPMALHRTVELLANEGNEESAIYDVLEKLLLDVRAAGADDATEERIMGVMDRLTGWCHASNHIRTKRNSLPTEEEIAKLPRWARVAFAARCARRSLPVCRETWDSSAPVPMERLARTIALAEEAASSATELKQSDAEFAEKTVRYCEQHLEMYAASVAHSALTAVRLATAYRGEDVHFGSAINAVNAMDDREADIAVSRDLEHLVRLSKLNTWMDETPVPPEVFGPLWPEGRPAGWPVDPDAPKQSDIALEVFKQDGLDERIAEDDVVNLFNAMNRFHIARGGQPLSLEDFQPLISALVPTGV